MTNTKPLKEAVKKAALNSFIQSVIENSKPPKKIKRPGDAVKYFKDLAKDRAFVKEQVDGFIDTKDYDSAITMLENMKYLLTIGEAEATKLVKKYGKDNENYPLAKEAFPKKDIWVWTGYTAEELTTNANKKDLVFKIFEKIDYLIDGPFLQDLKNPNLKFRGSANQRILKINHENTTQLYEDVTDLIESL